VRVLLGREKKCCFCKQGEITPLLQKAIPEIEKRNMKHNTQKIIKIKKNHKIEIIFIV